MYAIQKGIFLSVGLLTCLFFSQAVAGTHIGVAVELGPHYHHPYGEYYYAPYGYAPQVVYNAPPVYVQPAPVYAEYYYHPYHHYWH